MPTPIIIFIAMAFVSSMIIGWTISMIHHFKRMVITIDQAESAIDVALMERFEMYALLLDLMQSYVHKQAQLFSIKKLEQPTSISERQAFTERLSEGLKTLQEVIEKTPELKSFESIMKLQDDVIENEENLSAACRIYNANVSYYNQKVIVFPSAMIARWKNHVKRPFFEVHVNNKIEVHHHA